MITKRTPFFLINDFSRQLNEKTTHPVDLAKKEIITKGRYFYLAMDFSS